MEPKPRIYSVYLKGENNILVLPLKPKKNKEDNKQNIKIVNQLIKAEHLMLVSKVNSIFYSFILDGQVVAMFPAERVSYVTSRELYTLDEFVEPEGGAAE